MLEVVDGADKQDAAWLANDFLRAAADNIRFALEEVNRIPGPLTSSIQRDVRECLEKVIGARARVAPSTFTVTK